MFDTGVKRQKGGGDMTKKKAIVVCIFLILIILTVVDVAISAVESYRYDMDPTNGVDIFEGFGAVFAVMIGGFVVFYELDLFYTVYYFLFRPKTAAKSILNILSNLSLLLLFFADYYQDVFKEDVIAPLLVLLIYVILRTVSFVVPTRGLVRE